MCLQTLWKVCFDEDKRSRSRGVGDETVIYVHHFFVGGVREVWLQNVCGDKEMKLKIATVWLEAFDKRASVECSGERTDKKYGCLMKS